MKVQPTSDQDDKNPELFSSRRPLLPTILFALVAFILGGCMTLLITSRLLQNQLEIYSSSESMAAASAILDFMEDLLPLYLLCGSLFFLLLIVSATIWTWTKTESCLLRYGLIILIQLALAFIAVTWLLGNSTGPFTLPQPPTLTPVPS